MKYNEVIIQSRAKGGSELSGILNRQVDPLGSIIFSHSSHGSMDESVITELANTAFKLGYSTLKYNYHYVDKFSVNDAKFEDIMSDLDAAYETLLSKVIVKNIFFVGKSLGGVVSLKYLGDNSLRCPSLILGFFEPLMTTYVPDAALKALQGPVTVLQGELDQFTSVANVRTILGRNRVNYELFEVRGANHNFESVDENARPGSEILKEMANKTTEFLGKFTS